MADLTKWECTKCFRVVDAMAEESCPACGQPTPELNIPIPLSEALPVLYGTLLSIAGAYVLVKLLGSGG